ncbi:uncharacterized protein LOC143032994 [Oratosquilla oratoria]|uniref:uncharacterized protein LOC143032994 n=1 Tax=Oratosquilla oratoria TaxID=337810 RepID=UPI003F75914C
MYENFLSLSGKFRPRIRELPVPIREVPASIRELPVPIREVPASIRELPFHIREVPASIRELPVHIREVPASYPENFRSPFRRSLQDRDGGQHGGARVPSALPPDLRAPGTSRNPVGHHVDR